MEPNVSLNAPVLGMDHVPWGNMLACPLPLKVSSFLWGVNGVLQPDHRNQQGPFYKNNKLPRTIIWNFSGIPMIEHKIDN